MTNNRPAAPPPIRLTAHDRLQLEIKTELLSPGPTEEKASWSMDLWFTLPQATGIAPGSYSSQEFYEDLRAYTRLKTPHVPLDQLVRRDGLGSPLSPLTTLAHNARGGRLTGSEQRTLLQECKLLSAVLKSELRDWFIAGDGLPEEALEGRAGELASMLDDLTVGWRAVCEEFDLSVLPRKCRDVLSYCDESLSVQVQTAALDVVLLLPEGRRDGAVARHLKSLALAERNHRIDKGWRTVVDAGVSGADYVDQARLLKKYVSSVLHLHLRPNRWDGMARQGVPAIAAGLAMLWAVIAQIIMFLAWDIQLQRGVSLGFLGTFIALAVGAYILKDRIKAGTATALNRRIPALLSDRRNDLLMPNLDEPVGQLSERMSFERSSQLPPDVQALRTASARAHLLLIADQDVLRYTRHIELYPRLAATTFPRIDGLSDILRLNVWRWIRTYAGTHKQISFVDDEGKVQTRKFDNLYFVDVLVRFQRLEPVQDTRLTHMRLALSRRGLVGVEEVGTPA